VIAIQKIVLQGNSAMVTIPRAMMNFLGWRPGQPVTLRLQENGTIVVRLWRDNELQQVGTPGLVDVATPTVRG